MHGRLQSLQGLDTERRGKLFGHSAVFRGVFLPCNPVIHESNGHVYLHKVLQIFGLLGMNIWFSISDLSLVSVTF